MTEERPTTDIPRIGLGFDVHRLVEGRPCILGGVELPHRTGPAGHSDGDAVLLERERSVALAASRPAATLAWFSSDREVPLKDRVMLRLAVAEMPPAAAASSRLLVQVRRKVNRPLPR